MRTQRYCSNCKKLYRPEDKYGETCKHCKEKARKLASERRQITIKKKREKTKTLDALLFIFCIIILTNSINLVPFVSALRVEYIDTETILPGEESTIYIAIKNDGDDDIRDISIKLDFENQPFAPFNSNSEYGIDELKDGKTKVGEFNIIALNVKSGVYKIPLEITYRNEEDEDNTIITKNSLISLIVDIEPVIIVNTKESEVILKGRTNEISFEVLNKGLSDVYFVEAKIGESNYFTTLNDLYYLGDVDGDDWETAEFSITINNNAPRLIFIPITINYQDVLNNKYHKNLNINIRTYTTKEAIAAGLLAKNNTPIIIGSGIGIVILFIIYRKIKKIFKNRKKIGKKRKIERKEKNET